MARDAVVGPAVGWFVQYPKSDLAMVLSKFINRTTFRILAKMQAELKLDFLLSVCGEPNCGDVEKGSRAKSSECWVLGHNCPTYRVCCERRG